MKRVINFALAALIMVATAATAQAETMPRVQSMVIASTTVVNNQLSPNDLVSLARRGYFKAQDIPSYGAFDADIAAGNITSESLVKSAIAVRLIAPETINDRGYLNAVAAQLINVHSESL
jgi:hypothetical protein